MALHLGVEHTTQEVRRQRAVEALGLGERVRDERFDRITRLARALVGVKVSVITVLDQDRACYPGASGYDGASLPRRETLCDTVTRLDAFTEVPDATRDPRFADLELVRNGEIGFYAGAPLRDPMGNVIGVLCVFDPEPRSLSTLERAGLEDLAVWAQQELLNSAESSAAGRVQASLLPERPLHLDGWRVAGLCLPALAVGGDFYDYGATDGVLHLGLGDVMGKGTGAALLGAGVRAAIRATHSAVVGGMDLGYTATRVAQSQYVDLARSGSFATVFEAAVDLADGAVRYVDAGLGLVLVVRADGSAERLHTSDLPFGILPEERWTEHRAWLEPGDRLLVFSDGLLDVLDDPLRWWEPVARLVASSRDADQLLADIAALARTGTRTDDVTALVVERLGPADPRADG